MKDKTTVSESCASGIKYAKHFPNPWACRHLSLSHRRILKTPSCPMQSHLRFEDRVWKKYVSLNFARISGICDRTVLYLPARRMHRRCIDIWSVGGVAFSRFYIRDEMKSVTSHIYRAPKLLHRLPPLLEGYPYHWIPPLLAEYPHHRISPLSLE